MHCSITAARVRPDPADIDSKQLSTWAPAAAATAPPTSSWGLSLPQQNCNVQGTILPFNLILLSQCLCCCSSA